MTNNLTSSDARQAYIAHRRRVVEQQRKDEFAALADGAIAAYEAVREQVRIANEAYAAKQA